jgi:hypothetical protein
MLNQGLSIDLNYGFSGETGGIESGGDDRDCGFNLHQTPRFILARRSGTTEVPFLAENLHSQGVDVARRIQQRVNRAGCFLEEHENIMATPESARLVTLGD